MSRSSQNSQSSQYSLDGRLTVPHKPLSRPPRQPKFRPTFQIPRSNSIESLAESIIELEFPSPSLCNDHEMSQYISKTFDTHDYEQREPSPYLSAFPQSTGVFYLPSDSDSVRSSIIKYGEDVLGLEIFEPETRPATVLLPEIPSREHFCQTDQTYSALLRTSSSSTSTRTITPDPWTSSSKRSATHSQLDHLSAELAAFDSYYRRGATAAPPPYSSVVPPNTPTPSLAYSLSQASTLTTSPASTKSLSGSHKNNTYQDERNMEQYNPSRHHHLSRSRRPAHLDTSRNSVRQRTISQPLPSPKLPIHLSDPCFDVDAENTQPSQSKIDWSDDEESSARRTLKAIKKAVSHTNLRATGRARSDSATTQKRPPMPSPALSHAADSLAPVNTAHRHRKSSGSSTLAARLSRGSTGTVVETRCESPKKLAKNLSMKTTRSVSGCRHAEVATTPAAHGTVNATSTPSASKKSKKFSVRRLRAWLRKLMC